MPVFFGRRGWGGYFRAIFVHLGFLGSDDVPEVEAICPEERLRVGADEEAGVAAEAAGPGNLEDEACRMADADFPYQSRAL